MSGHLSYETVEPKVTIFLKPLAVGGAYEKFEIGLPRLKVKTVSKPVAPQNGTSSLELITGYAIVDQLVNGANDQAQVEGWLVEPGELDDFVERLTGAWIVIQSSSLTSFPTETTGEGTDESLENLPIGVPDSNLPEIEDSENLDTLFVGKIYDVTQDFSNFTGLLRMEAVDFGGWLNLQYLHCVPKVLSPETIEGSYDGLLVAKQNLPDFNQLIDEKPSKNRLDFGVSGLMYVPDVALPSFTISPIPEGSKPYSFSGLSDRYGANGFWHPGNIMDLIVSYIQGWEAGFLTSIPLEFTWQDKTSTDSTGPLWKSVDVISAKDSLWTILNNACPRDRGNLLGFDYSFNGNKITVKLVVYPQTDTETSGFPLALETINYTWEEAYPTKLYAKIPEIKRIQSDGYYSVCVQTKPVKFGYTFNLKNSFEPAWNNEVTPPELEDIAAGGVNEEFYQSYNLKLNSLHKLSTYGLWSAGRPVETWTDSITPITVEFDGPDKLKLGSSLDALTPIAFEQTASISTTLDNISNAGKNVEILVFRKIAEDDLEAIEGVTTRHNGNNIVIKGDLEFLAELADEGLRADIFITFLVQGIAPLQFYSYREDTGGESGIAVLQSLADQPVVYMPNSIVGVEEGTPKFLSNPTGTTPSGWEGTPQLRTSENPKWSDISDLYNSMKSQALFFLRPKHKCEWAISTIDTALMRPVWIESIEVPDFSQIFTGGDMGDPGALAMRSKPVDTVLTNIIWNFENGTTTYQTDFINYSRKISE